MKAPKEILEEIVLEAVASQACLDPGEIDPRLRLLDYGLDRADLADILFRVEREVGWVCEFDHPGVEDTIQGLIEWVWSLYGRGAVLEAADERMGAS